MCEHQRSGRSPYPGNIAHIYKGPKAVHYRHSHCVIYRDEDASSQAQSDVQAGTKCSKACKCESCLNQPSPGSEDPGLDEAIEQLPHSRRARGSVANPLASPGTPSIRLDSPTPDASPHVPSFSLLVYYNHCSLVTHCTVDVIEL